MKGAARRRTFIGQLCSCAFLATVMGILGWVAGYMTGASRESAVNDLMPAVLGLVGAFGGFAGLRRDRTLAAGLMVAAFALNLFVGAQTGGSIRERHEAVDRSLPPLAEMERDADVEAMIRKYRKDLGLEWPPQRPKGWGAEEESRP